VRPETPPILPPRLLTVWLHSVKQMGLNSQYVVGLLQGIPESALAEGDLGEVTKAANRIYDENNWTVTDLGEFHRDATDAP